MNSIPVFEVLHKAETPAQPDVLQFSPLDRRLLVVGTYQLADDGTRNGNLLLYSVDRHTQAWYTFLLSEIDLIVSGFRVWIAPVPFLMQIGTPPLLMWVNRGIPFAASC